MKMSKGSKPRPLSVETQQFHDNWMKIFGNQKKKKKNGKL